MHEVRIKAPCGRKGGKRMKGMENRKRLKRFLALLLTAVMLLPAIPVLADEEGEEAKVYDVFSLERGQILNPGDTLKTEKGQGYGGTDVYLFDYNETAFLSSIDDYYFGSISGTNPMPLPRYNEGDVEWKLNLKLSEFGGWQFVE